MSHFYVVSNNSWGASKTLIAAMQFAGVRYCNPFGSCVDILSYTGPLDTEDDCKIVREELGEVAKNPEDCRDEGTQAFDVIRTDDKQWEFSRADDVNGSPFYNWIGEGDKPEGRVPTTYLKCNLDLETGLISIREDDK